MLLTSTQISAVPAGTEPSETSSSCSGLYYSMAEYSQSIHLEFFVWEQQMPLLDHATHQGFGTGQDGNELSLSRGTSTRTLTSTNFRMRVPRYKLVRPFTVWILPLVQKLYNATDLVDSTPSTADSLFTQGDRDLFRRSSMQ